MKPMSDAEYTAILATYDQMSLRETDAMNAYLYTHGPAWLIASSKATDLHGMAWQLEISGDIAKAQRIYVAADRLSAYSQAHSPATPPQRELPEDWEVALPHPYNLTGGE